MKLTLILSLFLAGCVTQPDPDPLLPFLAVEQYGPLPSPAEAESNTQWFRETHGDGPLTEGLNR